MSADEKYKLNNPYHQFTRVFLFRQTKGNTSIPQCASTVGRLLVLLPTVANILAFVQPMYRTT